MTKREIRKKAQEAILKEGKTHQEAFDELRNNSAIDAETFANEIAKIPSSMRMAITANLRYTLIALLSLNVVMRTILIVGFSAVYELHPAIILPFVFLGIFVPAMGILAAAKGNNQLLLSTGLLMILSLVRGLKDTDFTDPITLVILAIVVATAGLCFYLQHKLKTPFRKTSREIVVDGQVRTQLHFEFESSRHGSDELLDNFTR